MAASPFISYAREDSDLARRLSADLQQRGVDPWLDISRIVAGDHWPGVIRVAIWSASHIILLISSRSIVKEGYVQHEVYEALARFKRMPPKRHFLIPVRLDKCEVPYDELRDIQRVNMFEGWEAGVDQIITALRTSESADSAVGEPDLMTELKEQSNVETTTAAKFGETLQTRAAVYAEAVRFIANADIHDDARATATLFDSKETTDDLFLTYLNLIAAKCRDAADRGGAFEHHALFAFHRDSAGRIPDGVKRGLDIRRTVFNAHGASNRLHLYEINEPILDMLLVGGDRAIIAFPESSTSSRLLHGISAIGLQSVSSLVNWYNDTLTAKAVPLTE